VDAKNGKGWLLAASLILALSGGIRSVVTRADTVQSPALSDAKRDKIVTYIRDRFGVPDTVKLALGPLHASGVAPGFSEGMVSSDDGKAKRSQEVLISSDARYLIVVVGSVIELQQKTTTEMAQRIRDTFKTAPAMKISVGGFKPSPTPAFEVGTLSMGEGAGKQDRIVLLSRDGKHLIVSDLYNLAVDPRQQALHTIALRDEATQGPADAPVTIVEYADLQCPTCARMHDFMETKVLPRYGNKVRIIFKDFPLVGIHDWSFTAAIADQCAFEINPSAYVPLRTAIFRSQQLINITNLRDTLLNYGEQAGVDRVQLAGCLDSKASLPRVQRDMDEGKHINITQTPTVFINGRMLIGLTSEDAYFEAIDQALRGK
jgi:protein-disulfide isomerase